MEELCIPSEVWNCVARYYETPILLFRLAEVCRNSYKGATMDSAWETFIPYDCEGSLYKAFIEAALATTEENRCIIRCCWTGRYPPINCIPEVPFERKDFDTAFSLATQNGHLHPENIWKYRGEHPHERSYLFDKCVQSRKFMVTALNLSSWLYDNYNILQRFDPQHVSQNPEYCEMAMRHSGNAWETARRNRLPVRKNYEFKKKVLSSNPGAFTYVFSPLEPCSEAEFILGSAPSYINVVAEYYLDVVECFVKCCHPNAFDLELCEKLCRIGFPIWVAKPNIEASFLRGFQCFTTLPPRFKNDRAIFESVAKNDCEILQDAIPEFRKDIPLVTAIFEHDPEVLHYCDPSIFTEAEFLRCLKEALRKPNRFLFRTARPHTNYKDRCGFPEAFPEVLQTQELALFAVESYGQWIHYFPRFWGDFQVMKAAVVTWPLAYRYAYIKGGAWSQLICKINPRAVWVAQQNDLRWRATRPFMPKAIQLGPMLDGYEDFPYSRAIFDLSATSIKGVLPEVLRAHPSNYKILCSKREINRRLILRDKQLIIAALEGTRDSSILWDVPPEILDGDIWKKAREVRQWK